MKIIVLLSILATALGAILGLDYGHEFTKAVLLAPGIQFEMVLTDEGKRKDLSGISIRSIGSGLERVYGSQTGSLCTRFPQSCVLDLKPLLGSSIEDSTATEYLESHLGVKLIGEDSRSGAVKFDLGFKNQSYEFTVEEILAMQLGEIKSRALNTLRNSGGDAIPLADDVAVTVPPFASYRTKQAYLDALSLAGFKNILGLVDEGTAAAINFLSNKKLEQEDYNGVKQYHVIYDMGAGSTKATLFSFTPYKNGTLELEVENVGYDQSLGGKYLTKTIYDKIVSQFLSQFKLKKLTAKLQAKLWETAEKAKLVLSINNEFHATLESAHDERDFKCSISRKEFEAEHKNTERFTKPISNALEGVIPLYSLNSVVLNGGSTRVPFVQKNLADFVGEFRISKSINTDESCAMGTTLRALKLKTSFAKKSDIVLIDKSYNKHSYAIGKAAQTVVFDKFSAAGQTKKIDLGDVKDTIDVKLYEDDDQVKEYSFVDVIKKADKLKCPSKSVKNVVATFSLDHNKMIDLDGLSIECTKGKGFLSKLLSKETEEGEVEEEDVEEEISESISNSSNGSNSTNNSTNSSSYSNTYKVKKQSSISIPLVKPTYPSVKPLLRTTKTKLSDKLRYLNQKDEERIQVDHQKNVLESTCYDLRAYIETHEHPLTVELKDLSEYSQLISESIEWLEFESDNATFDEINEKIDALRKTKDTMVKIVDMTLIDISKSGLKVVYEDGSNVVSTVQTSLLNYGEEVSKIRAKYEEHQLDFDKENRRLRKSLSSRQGGDPIEKISEIVTQLQDDLVSLNSVLQLVDEEFNQLPKMELFDHHDRFTRSMAGILEHAVTLHKSHTDRIDSLNEKFETLLNRKVQKELRQKLKEAEKEAERAEKEKKSEQGADGESTGADFLEEDEEAETVADTQKTESVGESETETTVVESETAEPENVEIEHDEL